MSLPDGIPADWPFRAVSLVVACPPHRWHVQVIGDGPTVLMLHGAGGATHSWRGFAPLLAERYRVVMLDLPGQGFTRPGPRDRFGLDAMAEDIAALSAQEGWHPAAVIGHSAGGAIALRLAEIMPLRSVVGINAALGSFEGLAGMLFPLLARALTVTPFVPSLFARLSGTTERVTSLIGSTGSDIGPEGIAFYRHLVARPAHVEATLGMMAQWRLEGLLDRLPLVAVPVLLLAAAGDLTVPPAVSSRAAGRMPEAACHTLPGGHLVHEEDPEAVAGLVLPFLDRHRGP
ncbi:MAG: alpha/beta fold hydrolase BchO [Gemmobacter sp.]